MSTTAEKTTPVYSDFGGDPDLGELVELFVEEMPDRIVALEAAAVSGDFELLRQLAHQLKGAAGSYGFAQLTTLAAALESSVRGHESLHSIERAFEELIGTCRRVRAGVAG